MKNRLLVLCLILFFLSGVAIGFFIGGHTTQEKWISFYERQNEKIEEYCHCNYPEEPKLNLNDFAFSSDS